MVTTSEPGPPGGPPPGGRGAHARPAGGQDVASRDADGAAPGGGSAGAPAAAWPLSLLAGPRRRWARVTAFAAFAIVLFAAYLGQARTLAASSNGAGQALQAWDMLHGNLLLHGWSLSDVSFYTTELPEYMVVEAVRGLNAMTLPTAAALGYALVVLLAGFLAKGQATGREGLVRMAVAMGIVLAPPIHFGTYLMLSGPDHIGTHVPLLIIWLLLDRAPARWWVPVATGLLLAWAQIADPLVLVEGAAPVAIVGALRAYQRRGSLRANWYELSLAAAAVVSAGVAYEVLKVIRHAGGFYVRTPIAGFASAASLGQGFWQRAASVLQVFGADFLGLPLGGTAIVALLHLAGLVLAVWAVAVAVRRFLRDADLLTQLLVVAFVLVLAAYVLGVKPDANEIVGLPVMAAVLAGRLLSARLTRAGLLPALGVVLGCYALLLATTAVRAPARAGNERIVSFLRSHHLSYGLAGFWNANSITMDTGATLQIRPARTFAGEVVLTPSESDATWYDPRQHDARFVLVSGHCPSACVSYASVRTTFGPPSRSYRVGYLQILVYDRNLLASPNLHTLYWCGNVWPWNTSATPDPRACR